MYTQHTIMSSGVAVKVYVSADLKHAVVFPAFGRYYQLHSDDNVLDFATTFIAAKYNNVISFKSYQSSFEDTALIELDKVA